MNYTKPEIRPLIYQDRDDIDLFDINDATALDAEMLRRIECSKIIEFDGANKYILDIFNNAYYITTLIMMEKHPMQFFSKYIIIAEHTSSAYNDIHHKNTLYQYFSAMIMAMVCNYLRLLDNYYSKENILILKIMDYFENEADTKILTGPYSLFSENALGIDDLKNYHINKESFQPRIVDAQAVYETNSKLNGMQKGWRGLTNDYNHKDITELLSICQNDEGKAVMADTIRREAEGYRCDETVDFIDSLDLPLTIDVDAATKNADVALLRHHCLLLTEQNSALAKQIPNPLTDGLTYEMENKKQTKELKVQVPQQKKEQSNQFEISEETLDSIQLKLRIEVLNLLMRTLGYNIQTINKKKLNSTMVTLYRLILGEGANSLLTPCIGKVTYTEKPKGTDEKVKEINQLLHKINEDWSIKL